MIDIAWVGILITCTITLLPYFPLTIKDIDNVLLLAAGMAAIIYVTIMLGGTQLFLGLF